MSQFQTNDPTNRIRRRDAGGGFDPTGRGPTPLNAPGLGVQRAVVEDSDFEELVNILGGATQTVTAAAAVTSAQAAQVAQEERARALRLRDRLVLTRTEQIANGELLPPDGTDVEGTISFYESLAEQDADEAGLEGDARLDFIDSMRDALSGEGLAQARVIRQRERENRVAELSSALVSASTDDQVDSLIAGIRETVGPNATESEVDALVLKALNAAAINGDRATVERLASRIGDTQSIGLATARKTLNIAESQRSAEAIRSTYNALDDEVATHLHEQDFASALLSIDRSDVSAADKERQRERVRSRQARYSNEQDRLAQDSFVEDIESLVRSGGDVNARLEQGVADGIVSLNQESSIRNLVVGRRVERWRGQMELAQSQTTDDAMDTMASVYEEAFRALETGVENPTDFAAISTDQFRQIQREWESFVQPILVEQAEQSLLQNDLQASMAPGGTYFSDAEVAGTTISASDRAENARTAAYQAIERAYPPVKREDGSFDKSRQDAAKIDWLAQNPQARDREMAGSLTGGAAVALRSLEDPSVLPAVLQRVEAYRSMKARNAAVAERHTADGDRSFYESVDLLKRALPSLPDRDAVQMAAGTIGKKMPSRSEVLGTRTDQVRLVDDHIGRLSEAISGSQVREEFLDRVEAASAIVGTRSVEDFASAIAEDIKSEYEVVDGVAVRMAGAEVDRRGLREIARMARQLYADETPWEFDDLAFHRNSMTGQWGLVHRTNGSGVGGPTYTDADIARIVNFTAQIAREQAAAEGQQKTNRDDTLDRYRALHRIRQIRLDSPYQSAIPEFTLPEIETVEITPEEPKFKPDDPLAPFFELILSGDAPRPGLFEGVQATDINLGGLQ